MNRTRDREKGSDPFLLRFGFLLLATLSGEVSAEVVTGTENETGLKTWEWRSQGVSVKLVQRLPDQTRAFFLGRGFSSKHADLVGRSCVFQTIFRSDGKLSVDYDLNDWTVHHGGAELSLKVRETWDRFWETEKVSQAARIAFRWSLLPTRQHYEPGDYNWGMTSFGLPPGETFTLALSAVIGGKRATDLVPGIECAPDRP